MGLHRLAAESLHGTWSGADPPSWGKGDIELRGSPPGPIVLRQLSRGWACFTGFRQAPVPLSSPCLQFDPPLVFGRLQFGFGRTIMTAVNRGKNR
jgi:hypothetical protein